ncbi:programmed cell death protein 2-like isoform X2 [Scomber scombrus]|uniref:programmed cell death protein 2-like isoform X2 n=1 Tax=Scomber scombrus TaxID=13677 RepID=UPI002DD9C092|nr:programmed cell death protein 2-like isoform X2 [Scomber scombrus]
MTSAAQTVTLLGLCDGELDPKRHQSSYLTNKVGGGPDWCLVAPLQLPRCARCRAPLSHVVQVYCPLHESPYHRTLHLFACPASGCSGRADCWTVLRSQCLEVEETSSRPDPAQEAPRSATDWCEAADDWGMEEEEDDGWGGGGGGVKKESKVEEEKAAPQIEGSSAGSETDVSSRLQDLRLAESQEEDDDVAPPVFRPFFVSVVEESDLYGEDGELDHAQKLLKEYERREGVKVGDMGDDDEEGSSGGGAEKYEKTKARHGDAVFSRFMKKISSCPQQILRYCRRGKPLFISEPPSNLDQVVSRCGSCGGGRTFELQLMPALVSLLRGELECAGGGGSAEVELEFGTVLVYTCTNSCWTSGSDSPVEEFCFVQMDPDQQLFK